MEPIQTLPLRERVINTLRDAIVNGELVPGQALVGTELANQIGVSQATLRDAIYALSLEGLVETVAYHVSTVKTLSKKDIEDLFSVRSMLESYAIRQIVATDQAAAAVSELYAICDEMEDAAEQDSLTDLNRIDRMFHDTLIDFSGNQLLRVLWNSVAQRVQQVLSLSNQQQGNLRQIVLNHREIAQVIENGDAEAAVGLMNTHISFVADEICGNWHQIALGTNGGQQRQ
ncbi:MAG: GntR family transcriptional regulator [Chloroflexi bacterium]|nr:GntR family transcriptional regulator [Chloroflexota bacterium]